MFITPCRPALSPLSAALRLGKEAGLAWLDGGLTHGQEGRFSFVGAAPVEVVERLVGDREPLAALDEIALRSQLAPGGRSAPPSGVRAKEGAHGLAAEDIPAWIGHIGYDAVCGKYQTALPRHPRLPCLRFARYDALWVFDHERDAAFLAGDSEQACLRLAERLDRGEGGPLDEHTYDFSVGAVSGARGHVTRKTCARPWPASWPVMSMK